jgi:hypothetical protein
VKPYRATIDFCLAADSIKGAAEAQDRLIEAAEKLGLFFEFASTGEMTREEVQPGSPLADALAAA